MSSSEPVSFLVVGGGWAAGVHAKAIAAAKNATLAGVADLARDRGGRAGRGAELAQAHRVPYFSELARALEDPRVEAVAVALPNHLHAPVALAALGAGKHVVIEKPLCLTLEEADRIAAAAAERRLVVGYAEELCFCPKFTRAKSLIDRGAIGELFYLRQLEEHAGPYSEWFFDPAQAGGGALMDMGCHSIEYARWIFGKAPVSKVTAKMSRLLHRDRAVEDRVIVHLELADNREALIEAGWALHGGMQSWSRHQGTSGVLDVDLLRDNGLTLFSLGGVPEDSLGPGWSRPDFEWLWQNGYPQEMEEFAAAIREGRAPSESVADGRAVLEIIWAAYVSAARGATVELPFVPEPQWRFPVEPWLDARGGRR